jgi:ABC-type thiamine transport system ATPase subunit
VKSVEIERTPRVMQLEGLFDVAPSKRSEQRWNATIPFEERDWNIGLIVGPSGCGKSTIARELFGDSLRAEFEWPKSKSLVDGFPKSMGIKDVTGLLSSVGFSSPPAWLRPYRCLSTGEQFRATIARALAEQPELAVIDEFTSVVDRTVAQIGSAAIARTVRASGRRFVAVGCHYDVIDWLQPDWIFYPSSGEFAWRLLQRRPAIELRIERVHRKAWELFRQHHYLSTSILQSAQCYVASVNDRAAAFVAVLSFPGRESYWREHRVVCLPDFQGAGIGNALSEFVAGMYRATGWRYNSITSHPGMIAHRNRSRNWKMYRRPNNNISTSGNHDRDKASLNKTLSVSRITAGFWYVGQVDTESALRFEVIK